MFYFMPILLIPLLFVSLKVPASTAGKQTLESRKPADHFVLFRNRAFLVYFIFSLGLSIYLSITMIFLAYILEYAGCAPSLLGLIVGWRALMEIISMSVKLYHMPDVRKRSCWEIDNPNSPFSFFIRFVYAA